MTRAIRATHAVFVWLFLIGLPIQFYLAGLGAFKGQSFDAHAAFGTLLTLISLIILLLALAGRFPRPLLLQSGGLFLLMVIQNVLAAAFADNLRGIAALHAVNGLLIVGAAIGLAIRSRPYLPIARFRPAEADQHASSDAASPALH